MADYWLRGLNSGAYSGNDGTVGNGLTFSGNNPVNIALNGHRLDTGHWTEVLNSDDVAALDDGDYAVNTVPDVNNWTVSFNGTGAGGTCDVRFYKWYTTEGGGTVIKAVPGASDNYYISYTALNGRSYPQDLYSDYAFTNYSTRSADHGGTDNGLGELDLNTKNYTGSGYFRIDGYDGSNKFTLKIGTSADTGLTCVDFYVGANALCDFALAALINNGGDLYIHGSTSLSTNYRGEYTQTANGTGVLNNTDFRFAKFTINDGANLSFAGNAEFVDTNIHILGTLTLNGSTNAIKFDSAIFEIASTGIIAGSGSYFEFRFAIGCTLNISDSAVNTFSGILRDRVYTPSARYLPIGIWRSADVALEGSNATGPRKEWTGHVGTMECGDFIITTDFNVEMKIDNTGVAWNLIATGDILFHEGSGTYDTVYLLGDGNITAGGSGTNKLDFAGATIEALIIAGVGGGYKYLSTNSVIATSITITNGTFDFKTLNCTSLGAVSVTNTGTLKGGSTADVGLTLASISMASGAVGNFQDDTKIISSGAIAINSGVTYTADTGAYTLTGAAANIDFGGKSIYSLTLNASGIKAIQSNFAIATDLILTAGIFNDNGKTITINGNGSITAGSMASNTGKLILAGAAKTFSGNGKEVNKVDVTGTYTFDESLSMNNLDCDGEIIYTYGEAYTVNDITGSGTLHSSTGDIVFVYYNGTNTFTGTLDNVVLVDNNFSGSTQMGLSMMLDL